MTVTCRRYADADLPRLQAVLVGWRREAGLCGYCHVGDLPFRIHEELRGRRPVGELVQVWEDDQGIAGVAIGLRFGSTFDLFTGPALRGTRRGAGDAVVGLPDDAAPHAPQAEGGDTWVVTDVFGCDRTHPASARAGRGTAGERRGERRGGTTVIKSIRTLTNSSRREHHAGTTPPGPTEVSR